MITENLKNTAALLEAAAVSSEETKYIDLEEVVRRYTMHFLTAMFPQFLGEKEVPSLLSKRESELQKGYRKLQEALRAVYSDEEKIAEIADSFQAELPEIYDEIRTDIRAMYEGDPAATSEDEVIITYPGFKAISIYRMAHRLYLMKVPVLARIMTEYAHRQTGIDIHPGATIGRYFFIDHGTGVVIGETTTIGDHVKLYQHVTLGAKSFELGEDGNPVKGVKRHPDIGSYVVIYAGATILGGDTHVGDRCVVGGNVWLTHSLGEGETITIRTQSGKRGEE